MFHFSSDLFKQQEMKRGSEMGEKNEGNIPLHTIFQNIARLHIFLHYSYQKISNLIQARNRLLYSL